MIYRIKVGHTLPIEGSYTRSIEYNYNGECVYAYVPWEQRPPDTLHICLKGGMSGMIFYDWEIISDFPVPKKRFRKSNAKFYFTELGWQLYGKHIAADLKKNKVPFVVEQQKNPKKSQIRYQDTLQMAVQPMKEK